MLLPLEQRVQGVGVRDACDLELIALSFQSAV
jgi:hypothetical protein